MHNAGFDLNAIRQLILKLKTDVQRIQSHINQTPESHIGDLPLDRGAPPESPP